MKRGKLLSTLEKEGWMTYEIFLSTGSDWRDFRNHTCSIRSRDGE
jgi:hypothetical protein